MALRRVKVVQSIQTLAMIRARRVHRVRILTLHKAIASKVNSINNCHIHNIHPVSILLYKLFAVTQI